MNKQELIEAVIELPVDCSDSRPKIDKLTTLELIKLLDEPEKVKVSEEEEKFLKTFDFNCENDVTKALYNVSRVGWGYYLTDNNGIELKDLTEEFRNLENRKRLIKAILDGYEVEKEKRYLVKAKEIGDHNNYLKYNTNQKKWYFGSRFIYVNDVDTKIHHTRKELEDANFGWVFDCPGIEIVEVENGL